MNESFFNRGSDKGVNCENLSIEMAQQIPRSGDYTEELFLNLAVEQGLLVTESEMITVPREKLHKGDKLSTVPDFIIKRRIEDEGIYVEVTKNSDQDALKNRQNKVMEEAGLGGRYVQLTSKELENVRNQEISLYTYIESKIAK